MDLELSDEQVWIERVGRHAARPPVAAGAGRLAGRGRRAHAALGEPGRVRLARRQRRRRSRRDRAVPGGTSARRSPGLGAVARQRRRPLRARAGRRRTLPAGFAAVLDGDSRVSVALLEPGRGWSIVETPREHGVDSAHRRPRRRSSTRLPSTISRSSRSPTANPGLALVAGRLARHRGHTAVGSRCWRAAQPGDVRGCRGRGVYSRANSARRSSTG